MVEWTHGDILKAEVEALVNPVNCIGVMGKGLALQFKLAFPENFEAYRKVCEAHTLEPGRHQFIHKLREPRGTVRWIINFPTKRHWRDRSKLGEIQDGLRALGSFQEEHVENGWKSIAIPAIGCGLGGLKWADVRPMVESYLGGGKVRVVVYELEDQ